MNLQNYLTILNIGVSFTVAWWTLRNSRIPSAIHLAILSCVVAFWSLAYLLNGLHLVKFPDVVLVSLMYLFSTIAPAVLLIFSLAYSNRTGWVARITIGLLAIEPLVTQLLLWVPAWRVIFFLGQHAPALSLNSGIWADINTIYLYNIEIASLVLITEVFTKKPRALLFRAGALLAGAFIPLVFRLAGLVSQDVSVGLFDYTIIGYSMAIIGLAHGLRRHSMIEVTPVTYERVIKGMTDGWIVLDLYNNIIDVNPAAEKIVGASRHSLYGKPIRSILPDWPDISNVMGSGKELEMRRSVRAQGNWRYLNVHISNLRDEQEEPFGQLIIWRDITERKQAEEARQRARDEMFVLLNAVSNAASHSMKLDDFLSESIYQLIYPFQSQVAAVMLIEAGNETNPDVVLRLVAHFGFSPAGSRDMDVIFSEVPIFNDVLESRQPLLVDDAQVNTRVPSVLQDAEIASLVLLPLLTQSGENGKLLGIMFLGRKEVMPYTHDEVIRLSTIAEQIANLIDSDRRRQLAIALSERENLMRDLHDSVSQKLYGLVTLTEAAQAGLEAGSKVSPTQILAKIGENARQAVKEMRLFLYQMQPVDLEKGDIVSALHHRLGAVEGRADIQARFLPDEGIAISKEKEVALYFIAQEALNNILKHAHANSVTVRLKQTRQNIILDVTDNGNGFDPENVEQGGMGLQNMKARAMRVNGALKIISKPGQGATIRVTVGRDRFPRRVKNRKLS